jgi:hypothetical protein
MKFRSFSLAIMAAVVGAGLFACDSSAPTGVGESALNASRVQGAGTAQAVPLKGTTEGMLIGVHPHGSPGWDAKGCPSTASEVVTLYLGYGHATHLGRFSLHGSECLDSETGQTANGEFTLTAANGDQLELGYVAGQAIPQPPFPPTIFHWTVQGLWCDGGTGRFASATCEGAWGGGFNMAMGTTWSTIAAAITYTASDRRD